MSDGVLYVEIMPSTKGIGKAVEGDLNKQFQNAEKTGEGFFSRVATWAKRGAIAIGGMVAAVGALAIGGGISRALNIEDAQAKLRGLGHDTQAVEAIMTNALASVKGTAFGLDTAATVAATAVAAGIKPGQELEKYLRLTADAATIAGVSMEEMGSILNKATTAGKVYTQELNQLADRGLPIFQWLQEEYGVTAEELRKMVERGEVDAETFRKVIEDNIGGAALAAGDTTRGAFANMRAAMSRFGEALIGPQGLGFVKTFFNEVTTIFDGLTDRAKPFIAGLQERFGDALNPEGMGDRFLTKFDEIVSAFQSGPIPQLLSALQPVLPAVAELAGALGTALGGAARELGEALAPVLPLIAEELTDAVVELTPSLIDLVKALVPIIPELVKLGIEVLPVVVDLLKELVPIVKWVIEEALLPFLETITAVIDYLSGETDAAGALSDLEEVGGSLMSTFDTVKWAFGVLMDAAQVLVDAGVWAAGVWQGVSDFFAGVWQTLTNAFTGSLALISGVWNTTWSWVSAFFGGIWNGIVSTATGSVTWLLDTVKSIPGAIMGALSGAATWLVNVGRDIIQGLINGVKSMLRDAVNAVASVGNALPEGIKKVLGINSPSRVFRDQVGKMVGLGLLEGVEDSAIRSRIDGAVSHLVEIPEAMTGGGKVVEQNNTIYMQERDERLVLRRLGRELNGALA